MWSRAAARWQKAADPPSRLEELRAIRRERERALRKARREQQLSSKRLVRHSLEEPDPEELAAGCLTQEQVVLLLTGAQRGTADRLKSLSRLRRGLQHREVQQTFVRVEGSMRVLVGLLTSSLAEMQMEAARCLHELSHSDSPAVCKACSPATPYLLTYLSGHSAELTELCLYTLGNLAVESEGLRRQLLLQGIVPALASCIQSPHVLVVEAVGYVLSQLLQAKEAPEKIVPLVFESGLAQHMLRLVRGDLQQGLGTAVEFAWSLHYLVCSQVNNALLVSLGIVSTLVLLLIDLASLLSQSAAEGLELLISPALRCLGNLLAEDEEVGSRIRIQDGRLLVALIVFVQQFSQQQPFVVQECLWVLNNLTADDPALCSAVLYLKLLPACLQLLPCSKAVHLMALMVLGNLAEKGPAYCLQLREQLVLPVLIPLLHSPDLEVVQQTLELLCLLFRNCSHIVGDFLNQEGLLALERYKDTPELQPQVQALLQTCRSNQQENRITPAMP
ncbi:transmembrane and coiled-coil domain-containing protein 6 isoform X1 [Rhinatrema bivittatum]|uniref:transmembrane and coiled-coil domain-containing protein 6 isoform X1 n=1 Tax=Rhinatrema bivittatum TaxID=194408 RepID=UPI0011282022|nr:transmembrane and coiled-coil domain-containing protein 6 isoform X1 [Rhinatrema bivittatum]